MLTHMQTQGKNPRGTRPETWERRREGGGERKCKRRVNKWNGWTPTTFSTSLSALNIQRLPLLGADMAGWREAKKGINWGTSEKSHPSSLLVFLDIPGSFHVNPRPLALPPVGVHVRETKPPHPYTTTRQPITIAERLRTWERQTKSQRGKEWKNRPPSSHLISSGEN